MTYSVIFVLYLSVMKREIEIKYLLDGKEARDSLIDKLQELYPEFSHQGTKRIMSYFYKRNASKVQILAAASSMLSSEELENLTEIVANSSELIVKCRSINETNYFAVKGTPAGEDPVHAVNRLEFETVLTIELEEIDSLLRGSGIETDSKWLSKRDYFALDGVMSAEIEFVSGYGYKVELEIVINDGESVEAATRSLEDLAKTLELTEASQGLLGKMYEYYNAHWQDYFNTGKVFDQKTWKALGRYINY